jgi:hypothetical protein
VQADDTIQRVWAALYSPAYEPPAGSGAFVEETTIPTHTLTLSTTTRHVYEAVATDVLTETGTYRIVVYAEDAGGVLAHPAAREIQVVEPVQQAMRLYLPLIMRQVEE